MTKIIEWIKQNRLLSLLLVLVVFFAAKTSMHSRFYNLNSYNSNGSMPRAMGLGGKSDSYTVGYDTATTSLVGAPELNRVSSATQEQRKTIEDSNLSILVKDVSSSISSTQQQAESLGGYLVSSNINRPTESMSGSIVVRVPLKSRNEFLNFVKGLGLKTITENYSGYDITDAYTDNEARLTTLNQTKSKFEEIFSQAVKIDDILRVQNELINIQYQIDAIKGQQKAMDQASSTTKISIYFASDEYALPYAPDTNWKPETVFKLAVRSLVLNLRGIASAAIWLTVYAALWLPLLLIAIFAWKKFFKNV